MYGRATGGIIDVQIKKLQPPKIGGYADVSLLDTGVYLEVPLGDKGGHRRRRPAQLHRLHHQRRRPRRRRRRTWSPRRATTTTSCWPTTARRRRTTCAPSSSAPTTELELLFQQPGRRRHRRCRRQLVLDLDHFYRSLLTYRYVPGERFENSLRLSQGRDWFDVQRRAARHRRRTSTRARCATPSATSWPSRCRCPTALDVAVPARPTSWCSCRCRPRRASRMSNFDLERDPCAARATTTCVRRRPASSSWS